MCLECVPNESPNLTTLVKIIYPFFILLLSPFYYVCVIHNFNTKFNNQMKNIVVVFLAALFAVSCSTEPQFKITGNVEGTEGLAILKKRDGRQLVDLDTAQIENNQFVMTGKLDAENIYYLELGDKKKAIQLFMGNDKVTINGNIEKRDEITITGSPSNDIWTAQKDGTKGFKDEQQKIYKEFRELSSKGEMTPEKQDELRGKYDELGKKVEEFNNTFIAKNKTSVVAAWLTSQQMYNMDADKLEELFNSFSEPVKASEFGKKIAENLEMIKKTAIGQPFIDFAMADKDGKELKVSDFTGKGYLLIDFWASWCGPCRGENPNLVKAYAKYHDKGFEIFGVSFDQNKEKWLEAVEADNMTWIHVSDLKGWGCAAGKLYGVRGIPSNVLVDKDGKMIAKNLRGNALEEKLAELLD
ncbi:redoxin domain-containing protein [Puteibacter caeruleilacunae]|nr:redoxin domain-containing protein [Puteibacter caeruleilacunae]